MAATIEISVPDTLVKALGVNSSELSRQTLEALIIQSYRAGKITHSQVAEMLKLDRWQTDAFLKNAQAHRTWENEEFAADLATLRNCPAWTPNQSPFTQPPMCSRFFSVAPNNAE